MATTAEAVRNHGERLNLPFIVGASSVALDRMV